VRKIGLRGISIGLLVVSLLVAVSAIQASTEEEYNLKASLQSPEPDSSAEFGFSVAVSGDTVVAGEHVGKVDDVSAGKAHIIDSDGTLLTTIQSPEPSTGFGYSVAVSGDTVVVGERQTARAYSRAYIFDSDGNLQSTLQSPTPMTRTWFGFSVAVSGDTVVVGEPRIEVEDYLDAGRAYVFDSDGNLQSTLQSPTPRHRAYFGCSVAADGDNIVVGEVQMSQGTTPAGPSSAYVFDSEGNLLTTLQSSEPDNINFGWSVDISEDIIVVGESLADVDGNSGAGRAYIFDTDGNLLTTLQAPTPEENAEFGFAVAVSGDTVVVGEYKADVEVTNEGRAHVFDLDGKLLATLQSPTPGVAAYFGYSVAVSGDTILVGEPSSKVEGESKAGRAYIFGPGPGTEPETEPEPETETTETKPAAEEKSSGGIPGFPYESIILGLVIGAFALWLLCRK